MGNKRVSGRENSWKLEITEEDEQGDEEKHNDKEEVDR